MLERWKDVVGFPDYSVSNHGQVYADKTGKILKQYAVQYGIMTVMLRRDGKQNCRSVAMLVATAFIERPRQDFNTPIHLDGDRSNCRVDNLMWRTRPYAVRWHRERANPRFPNWRRPFEIVETGEQFDSIIEAAMRYGVLESELFIALTNENRVFLLGSEVRYLETT